MTELLILQGWKDYDVLKKKLNEDPRFFRCSEQWEVDFLVRRIQRIYSGIPEVNIREAIANIAALDRDKCERKKVVHNVVEALQRWSGTDRSPITI